MYVGICKIYDLHARGLKIDDNNEPVEENQGILVCKKMGICEAQCHHVRSKGFHIGYCIGYHN